jgi:protein SCO1
MRRSVLLPLAILAIASPAYAGGGDTIMPPPPTYEATGVEIQEHLGARLPVDARFRTADGTVTTLGAVLSGETPVILTFNYSDCPLLCSLQLNGLTAAMPQLPELRAGVHYRIITISLNPDEQPHKLAAMRAKYLERLPEAHRDQAKAGWTFLIGDEAAIRRVADTVGFKYRYIADRAEWAHPAAFVFVSTGGTVTRYVHGFELQTDVFRESIIKAGMSEPATAAGFAHLCYFFDPDAKNHSRAGVLALRIGAAGFVVLIAALGMVFLIRKKGPTP